MAISGLIGAGAQAGLDDLLRRQIVQQQVEQRMREFEAEQGNRQQQMDLQRRQIEMTHSERSADRQQLADDRAAQRRIQINLEGLRRMDQDREQWEEEQRGTKTDSLLETLPAPVRQIIDISRLTGVRATPEMLETPEAAESRRQAEEDADVRRAGRIADAQASAAARHRAAGAVRPDMTPGQKFNATRALRNDFVRESQAAREVQNQFRLMQSALGAAKAGDLAAGSQGVLVTFQKILDPTSVVRESEYARSASGQALLARIEGAAEKLAQGGAGVPVAELERFVALADQFAQNQARAAGEAKTQIDAIADEFGIDPSLITREIGGGPPGGGTGGTVRLMAPNGQVKDVPEAEAARYLAAGAKRVP